MAITQSGHNHGKMSWVCTWSKNRAAILKKVVNKFNKNDSNLYTFLGYYI